MIIKHGLKKGDNFGIQKEHGHWKADSHKIRSDNEVKEHFMKHGLKWNATRTRTLGN